MYFVLLALIEILLLANQLLTFVSSVFVIFCILSSLLKDRERVLSSANKVNLNKSLALGRSLIKIKNSSGPSVEPCGTPCVIIEFVE